jgi:hypothetical protein
MRDIAICLAVLVLLAGCGGSSHRKSGPQSVSPPEQPKRAAGTWSPAAGTSEGPAQLVAEVPYPQTAADCVRQLEAEARVAKVRFTMRETRPKGQGFSCVGDVQR